MKEYHMKDCIKIDCTNVVGMMKMEFGLKEFKLTNMHYKKIPKSRMKCLGLREDEYKDEFIFGDELVYGTNKTKISQTYIKKAIRVLEIMDTDWDWDYYECTKKTPCPLVFINNEGIAIIIAPRVEEEKEE